MLNVPEVLKRIRKSQEISEQLQNVLNAYMSKFNKIDHNVKVVRKRKNSLQKKLKLLESPKYFEQCKNKYVAKYILYFLPMLLVFLALCALYYFFLSQTFLIRVTVCTFISPFLAASFVLDLAYLFRCDDIVELLFNWDNKSEIAKLKEELYDANKREAQLLSYQESLIPNYENLRAQWIEEGYRIQNYEKILKKWEMTQQGPALDLQSSEPTINETRKGR